MSKQEFVYRKEGLKLTKPDEIVVEQREDIKELKKQISDLEKALELACKVVCNPKIIVEPLTEIETVYGVINYFKEQAKEMIKSE